MNALGPNQITVGNDTAHVSKVKQLRRRYFAQTGVSTAHLGVTYERVILHLWRARRRHPQLRVSAVACLDDLAIVTACVDGSCRAWHELHALYEPLLVRRLRRIAHNTEAVLAVRKVLTDLRRSVGVDSPDGTLCDYLGVQPLRDWLAGRILNELSRNVPHDHLRGRAADANG